MKYEWRSPNVVPINDHIWLMDDHGDATWYVVAGRKEAMAIDTSIGLSNVREEAEKLTNLPLICVNTHGHGDHIGGNWSFDRAYMNLADLSVAKESLAWPEVQEGIRQLGLRYPKFEPIQDGQIFDLGGLCLEALYLPGHTPGEIVLLDRKDRIRDKVKQQPRPRRNAGCGCCKHECFLFYGQIVEANGIMIQGYYILWGGSVLYDY